MSETKQGVRGFVSIRCAGCGKVTTTCLREERTIFVCRVCGDPTPLEGLRTIRCECGRCGFKGRYRTNRTEERIQMECLQCSNPVHLRRGFRRGNYVVEGERAAGEGL